MDRTITLDECVNGGLYRISSRNLTYGVYREESKGFIGIRKKFENQYLFTEYHYDIGAPFGTVRPWKFLEHCPIEKLDEFNNELFQWLASKKNEYTDRASK